MINKHDMEMFQFPPCPNCGGELLRVSGNEYKCKNCAITLYVDIPLFSVEMNNTIRNDTKLRNKGKFDSAEAEFQDVIDRSSNKADLAEAYWGRFLCAYGIMHIEDKKTISICPRFAILKMNQ